jgi:Protein of unknown function (DUF3618)
MADPDRAVVAQSAAAAQSAVDARDPDALVAQIERTRENLAQTIDFLAERVSPANNVRRLRSQLAEQAARPEVRKAGAAIGLAVAGLIIYRMFARRRR